MLPGILRAWENPQQVVHINVWCQCRTLDTGFVVLDEALPLAVDSKGEGYLSPDPSRGRFLHLCQVVGEGVGTG